MFDFKFFEYINNLSRDYKFLNNFFIVAAEYFVFIFLIVCAILWFRKNKDYIFQRAVLFSVYSACAAIILNFLVSKIKFRLRPFIDKRLINVNQIISHSADASFPSDHTTFMLAIAFSFCAINQTRKLGVVLTVIALISGFSRIYCGLHFPLDIIGALMIALIVVFFIFILQKYFEKINLVVLRISKRFKLV